MATSSDERICANPGCHTPIPDDGTICPNCGEFVDLPDIDDETPAIKILEESSPRYFFETRKKRPAKKLSKEDRELVDRFLGRENSDTLQLFKT